MTTVNLLQLTSIARFDIFPHFISLLKASEDYSSNYTQQPIIKGLQTPFKSYRLLKWTRTSWLIYSLTSSKNVGSQLRLLCSLILISHTMGIILNVTYNRQHCSFKEMSKDSVALGIDNSI